MSSELTAFRHDVTAFLDAATASGVACSAYGAILAPDRVEEARRWQRHCSDEGFAGLHWPPEYGGRGLTRAHTAVWMEECARSQIAPYLNLQGLILAGEAILRAGTPAQKERFLRPTLQAEIIWCQLFSEPGAGSDLAGLQTRAERDGDRFVVNGQKVWSSNAELAQFGIMLARTDPDAAPHRGLSFFCYDMSLPGTEVRPLRQMTGDAEFSEVFLTDVSMPRDALLGELNRGWQVAMEVLQDERGSVGSAGAISLNIRLAELAAGLTSTNRVTRDEFADLMAQGRTLGLLLERGDGDPTKAPIAKVAQSELGHRAVNREVVATGAAGMLDSELVDRFLYSPGMRIAGGSSEIQRNIIGERLLGLPREPR